MKFIKKIVGIVFCLVGAYLIFFEVGMAISESHALFCPAGVVYFSFFVLMGIAMIYMGIKFFRK